MHAISMSVNDACRLIGIKRTKMYQLISSGSIQIAKVGKRTLVLTSSILSFLESSRVSSPHEHA